MKKVPGPRGTWPVGHLLQFRRDPLGFVISLARQCGPVAQFRLGPVTVISLNEPGLIELVLVTNRDFFSKPHRMRSGSNIVGNGLVFSEGPFWQRQRRLMQPAFHRERVGAYGQIMVDCADRMMARWESLAALDAHKEMLQLALEIVGHSLFSVELTGTVENVHAAIGVLLERTQARTQAVIRLPRWLPTPGNRKAAVALRSLDHAIFSIIEARRQSQKLQDDLLGMLLAAVDEDGRHMTDQQLRDEVMTLFLAGHETTANALSWVWYCLSQNPAVEAKLHAELESVLGGRNPTFSDVTCLPYAEMVVSEALRLYPPAWFVARQVVTDCVIGEYRFPAGAVVMMSPYVVHRSSTHFPEPDQFRPERWDDRTGRSLPSFTYFPFGGGPRQCIGKGFALLEMLLVLATVAQRFRLSLLPGFEPQPEAFITLRPWGGMRMTIQRR